MTDDPVDGTPLSELACGEGHAGHTPSPSANLLAAEFHTDMTSCVRCGADVHPQLLFRQFRRPMEHEDGTVDTHWAMCPVYGEPLILYIEPKERP